MSYCIALPDPPTPAAPPTPPTVPAPPPPASPPPGGTPGLPQVALDLGNSYILGTCTFSAYTLSTIASVNGTLLSSSAELTLMFRNTSTTANGTAYVAVHADNASLAVTPATVQTVLVTPGNTTEVHFSLVPSALGTYVITIDMGNDNTYSFNLAFSGGEVCGSVWT